SKAASRCACHRTPRFLPVASRALHSASTASADEQIKPANQSGIRDCPIVARCLWRAAAKRELARRLNYGRMLLLFFRPAAPHRPAQPAPGLSRFERERAPASVARLLSEPGATAWRVQPVRECRSADS